MKCLEKILYPVFLPIDCEGYAELEKDAIMYNLLNFLYDDLVWVGKLEFSLGFFIW